jgi:hypothetical protein
LDWSDTVTVWAGTVCRLGLGWSGWDGIGRSGREDRVVDRVRQVGEARQGWGRRGWSARVGRDRNGRDWIVGRGEG